MTPANPVCFLLVDDREENLLALEALLRREGLVLQKVCSGPDALEVLLKHEVALAFIDVQMPGMDGFELAELMRGAERTRRVPIIFLTAENADQQRRFRGYEAGAVDFLHKPLEPDILKSKAEVFFELACQRQEVIRQRDALQIVNEENARLLKESRQYAQALKETVRRKDEFLAILSHELRNPLAPIRNAVQILNRQGLDDATVQAARNLIERQSQHMVRLVDDLLDASRIARGKLELRREVVALAAVVEQAVEMAQPHIKSAGHDLTLLLPPQPLFLDADPARLAQVISNLLQNACKYTEKGGRIWLAAKRAGSDVVVSVKDTGIGISPEHLSQLFEMFSQMESSFQRSQGGLGIGLSLVKGLVEMHGGTVEARSEGFGKGSEFIVRLPVIPVPQAPLSESGDDSKAAAAHRILLADDHMGCAESLALLLRLHGNEVEMAHDGFEAVEAAERYRPSVVLLDIGMPKLNGYEACRRIREQAWGKDMVIVAMTGWGQEEDRRRSKEAGFNGHLLKPVDYAALEEFLASTA
nr:response regulator [Nitrosococcus wardiae]